MGSDRRQQLQEQYEDAVLALLMDEYAEAEGAQLLREFEELEAKGAIPELPAELDKKCKKIIDSAFRRQKIKLLLKQAGRFATKVAVVALAILGLSTATVLSVDAFRAPVLNFIMDRSGKFSKVAFSDDVEAETDSVSATIMRFEGCLPEGYQVCHKNVDKAMCSIHCVNASNSVISLNVSQTSTGLAVDTEDAGFAEVEFGEFPAAFQEKNGYHLMWVGDDEIVYILYANGLSTKEFWELAYATAG